MSGAERGPVVDDGVRPARPADPAAARPLEGLRVVDFSRLFAGPLCTMILADLGADVVKVEAPGGDEARHFGPPFLGGEGMNFMALNRGKRSVVIDLKTAEGRARAYRLLETADVVVENFRPGVSERLGIDEPTVRSVRDDVVYCSITGFGPSGVYRDRPALDLVLQGMGGVMHRQGRGQEPKLVVITIADCYAAALAVQGILAALLVRERGGPGQLVEVNLFQALLFAQAYRMMSAAGEVELAAWEDVAPYGPYLAADEWFNVAVVTERTWAAFCDAIERPYLREDTRFLRNPDRVENKVELDILLGKIFETRPAAHWLEVLDRHGVPCGPILAVEDLFTDPHVVETGGIVELEHEVAGPVWTVGLPFTLSATPPSVGRPAPQLGEHTDEVFAELGITVEEAG